MIEYIYGFIYTSIYVFLLVVLSGSILKKKKRKHILFALIILGWISVQFVVSVVLDQYVAIKMFVVILINLIAIYGFYEGRIVQCIFVAIMYQAIVLLCDFVSIMCLMKINQNLCAGDITNSLQGFLASIVSLVILLSLVYTIKRITSKDGEIISEDTWIKLSIMPVISVICIVAMYVNFSGNMTGYQRNTVLVLALVFILVNLYVYYLVHKVAVGKVLEGKNEVLKERNNQIYKNYIEAVEQYKFIRKKEHEYKNTLMALYAIAKRDGISDMMDILEKEIHLKGEREYVFDTNNTVTNLIFNHMYHIAEEKNILLTYKFNDLQEIPLSEKDTAVLYSNILNNAMEACEKLDKKRRIHISSHCEKSNFIIIAENQFDGKIKKANGQYFTNKEDMYTHGYGMANIVEIVNKYNGTFIDEVEGNVFRIVIIIPR